MRQEGRIHAALAERRVWPSLTQAADIIGVSKSTLSKRAHCGQIAYTVLGFGRGRHVLSPEEVLRIGWRYQRVPQDTVVERLAGFLSARIAADAGELRRVLRALMTAPRVTGQTDQPAPPLPQTGHEEPADALPSWLVEVDHLRANPAALTGALAFAVPDDLLGTIKLGPAIDIATPEDSVSWPAPW